MMVAKKKMTRKMLNLKSKSLKLEKFRTLTKIRTRIRTKKTKRDPKASRKVERNVKVQKLKIKR